MERNGDASYTGLERHPEALSKSKSATFYVAAKPGTIKTMAESSLKDATVALENAQAAVRALVEHPFQIVKRRFDYAEVRYRGIRKNLAKLEILLALLISFLPSEKSGNAPSMSQRKKEDHTSNPRSESKNSF